MSSGDGQPNRCPKELMGLLPSSAGVTGKSWWLTPGCLLHICRPPIEGLNIENHGPALSHRWFLALSGWLLPKFGFLSRQSGGDFWCDQSVCVWLTRGQGFLRDAGPHGAVELFLQWVSILSHFGNWKASQPGLQRWVPGEGRLWDSLIKKRERWDCFPSPW